MKLFFSYLIFFISFVAIAQEDFYTFKEVRTPDGIDSQVGGMDFTPDGRLVVCFHRGDVMTYNPKNGEWKKIAEGLHEPLGIVALSNTEFLTSQRPELTLLKDSNGDGEIDLYKTFFDGFGMTGNYHEFHFGPARDKDGNLFIGLNIASNGASIREEIRGEFHPIGLPREDFMLKDWKNAKNDAGRMYSRVPYRGWILKISPDGKSFEPYACGVRSPNGLGFDSKGNLFVTDNQGDWLGTSKLHHVKKDRFHGHPASLVWREGWTEDPLKMPVEKLESLRTRAAILFPQGIMANSPTQPLLIDHDKFGPYKNQLLIGEMNFSRVLRFMPDEVNGVMQGAIIAHLNGDPMKIGNNRMAWAPDGSLYIGRTKLSWAGDRGITKVTWNGKVPFDVQNVTLTSKGFKVEFTEAVKEIDEKNLNLLSYTYTYHKDYGSPQISKRTEKPELSLSSDRKVLLIHVNDLRKGFVYDFTFSKLTSTSGNKLKAEQFCYTLNELR
jgi:glucose/arabinose dehydrogenase